MTGTRQIGSRAAIAAMHSTQSSVWRHGRARNAVKGNIGCTRLDCGTWIGVSSYQALFVVPRGKPELGLGHDRKMYHSNRAGRFPYWPGRDNGAGKSSLPADVVSCCRRKGLWDRSALDRPQCWQNFVPVGSPQPLAMPCWQTGHSNHFFGSSVRCTLLSTSVSIRRGSK